MKFKKITDLLIISVAICLVLGACGKGKNEEKTSGLKIVTTFYPIYDFTRNVVGDDSNIVMLIDADTEPHDYEPSAKDIAKIQDADVFIYNADDMEVWVAAVLKNIDMSKVTVIEASKDIKLLEGETEELEDESHSHGPDPHVWLDPILAKQEVETIQAALTKVDKKNQEIYQKNAEAYSLELTKLDQAFETSFKTAKERTFVTQHTAFAYLAKRYNLTQKSITGLSPDQEPTPGELAKIEDYVKKNKVKVIYTEDLASTKIAETIAASTRTKLEVLSPIEGISINDQKAGLDYIAVMENNLNALKKVIK